MGSETTTTPEITTIIEEETTIPPTTTTTTESTTSKKRRFGSKRLDRFRQRIRKPAFGSSASPLDAIKLINSKNNAPVRSRFVPGAKKNKQKAKLSADEELERKKLQNKRTELFKKRVRIQRPRPRPSL